MISKRDVIICSVYLMLACKHMAAELISNSGVGEIQNIQTTPKNEIHKM